MPAAKLLIDATQQELATAKDLTAELGYPVKWGAFWDDQALSGGVAFTVQLPDVVLLFRVEADRLQLEGSPGLDGISKLVCRELRQQIDAHIATRQEVSSDG